MRRGSLEQEIVADISRFANAMNCIRHHAATRPPVFRCRDLAHDRGLHRDFLKRRTVSLLRCSGKAGGLHMRAESFRSN